MAGSIESATVASDEDMQFGFVLVDEHAPTAEAALVVLLHHARVDWDVVFRDAIDASQAKRRWYKFDLEDEERMLVCEASDPDRDSEWWWFSLPEWSYLRGTGSETGTP